MPLELCSQRQFLLTPLKLSQTTMFAKVALLSVLTGLAAGAALDVWAPPITSPTAASVWPVGSLQNVTW